MSERCVFCGEPIPEGRQVCILCEQKYSRDTDKRMVSVEEVLETIRDMAHHPMHMFRADDLLAELERRLMRKNRR